MFVFADTGYWIALINPQDDLHKKALEATALVAKRRIVTSDFVLTETLNYFGEKPRFRQKAALFVEQLANNTNVVIVPATRELFLAGVDRFKNSKDKGWSVVDCASFHVMEKMRITEALSPDHHFKQASFAALMLD